MKSVSIRSFSGLYFPTSGLNMERYKGSLQIQSKCRKIRTRKTPKTDIFHAVASITCAWLLIGNINLSYIGILEFIHIYLRHFYILIVFKLATFEIILIRYNTNNNDNNNVA